MPIVDPISGAPSYAPMNDDDHMSEDPTEERESRLQIQTDVPPNNHSPSRQPNNRAHPHTGSSHRPSAGRWGGGCRPGGVFCSTGQWRALIFRSLGKDRLLQLLYFLMGPIMLFVTLAFGAHNPSAFKMVATIGVTLLMVVWWLFEVLPLGVTSFLPVVLFPIMGIVPGIQICGMYLSDQVLILFGSCMLATAVEEYNLHRRLALAILRRTGDSPYRLVLGFLLVTAFLSMWLSNTATAAMMAPLASAVMDHLTDMATPTPGGEGHKMPAEGEGERGHGMRALAPSSSTANSAGQDRPSLKGANGRGGGGTDGPQEGGAEAGDEMVEIRFWDQHTQQAQPGSWASSDPSNTGGERAAEEERGTPPAPSPSMQSHLLQHPQAITSSSSGGREGEGPLALASHPRSGSLDSLGSSPSHVGAGDYWCGIRIESIQFSISVAICYGASLGGMSTLTGTGTNLVLNGVLASNFANAVPVSFGTFFCIAGPIALFCVLGLWVYLCWNMRMVSSNAPFSLRLALRNLLPNGYEAPSSLLNASPEPHTAQSREDEELEHSSSSAVNGFELEYRKLPPLGWEEKVIMLDFCSIAALWFFRDPKGMRGWTQYLPAPSFVTDGTVAMIGALALFIIPRKDFFAPPPTHPRQHLSDGRRQRAGSNNGATPRMGGNRGGGSRGPSPSPHSNGPHNNNNHQGPMMQEAFGVLPWDVVLQRMPWNVLFLVGGGLALSLAYKESNLSHAIATAFTGLETVPFPIVEASVCVVTILISNFISNVATANIILPPLGCIAVQLGRHPLALMLPATLAGSFSFISPIATPANAIAYSMGHLTVAQLAYVGSILTVVCVFVLSVLFPPLFTALVDGLHVPEWAKNGC